MSRPTSSFPSSAPTPAPSSPPPSESFLSDIDGTAPSLLETTGDYSWEATNVDSTGLNLVSWKLDVNARAEDGVEKRGFNAISTVLNHPTKRADPLRSSRKPLPPLGQAAPVIPRPPPASHYDSYLESVTPLYESLVVPQASSSRSDALAFPEEGGSHAGKDLPPLESVPEAFFDPAFDLANPAIWASLVDEPQNGPLQSAEDTQDAMSTHLDTLERHLIHEIALRSSAFFSALSNLQDLHSESASCLSRITDLQSSLQDVGTTQAKKGLEVIDAQDKLRVLRLTEQSVKTVAEVEELMKVAQGLVDAGDWAGGLGCLSDVMSWWEHHGGVSTQNGNDTAGFALATLPAVSALPDSITRLTSSIAAQLETAFSSLLSSILTKADTGTTFDKEDFRTSAAPMLAGLARCGKAGGIEDTWREVMTTAIREGSRKHLPVNQAEEDGDEEGRPPEARGASLAESLKAMDHSTYLLLSTQMNGTMLSRLRLGFEMGDLIEDIAAESSNVPVIALASVDEATPATTSPSETKLDLSGVLASACELANNRASKILGVRSEQHAQLPLSDFVELFKENWDFVIATETLAKRMIVHLRGVTASQARAFLVTYHSIRLTKSANLVQEEQWAQIDVAPKTQHIVNVLMEAAVSDPAECAVPPPASASNGTEESKDAPVKVLNIEEKSFFVVKATAESLTLLGDYLKIVINLELVVTDVMSRIIEFLKSFNSRTCQVVLGAGAMRSAGLKNITAKHLALASQSLSVIVALIPYIREFIRRHLNPKQAVMLTEFDKLKRDYQEHQNEIHAKLVAIMSDRLAVHVGSLREIDWESTPDKDGARQYAEMLVKETTTLHKVLSKYIATATVEGVLSEVLAAIVHRLSEEYGRVELKSDDAKKRMVQDVILLNAKLAPLSESGKSMSSLETLVKDKPTPRRPIGQAMRGMFNNSGAGPKTPVKEDATGEPESGSARKTSEEDEEGPIVEEGAQEPKSAEKDGPVPELEVSNGVGEEKSGADIATETAASGRPADQNGVVPQDNGTKDTGEAHAEAVPEPISKISDDSKTPPPPPEKERVEEETETQDEVGDAQPVVPAKDDSE